MKKLFVKFTIIFLVIINIFLFIYVMNRKLNSDTKTLGINSETSDISESNFVSPTPIEETKLNTEPTVSQKSNFVPSSIPFPTSDPDPVITCNSKTGKLAVRLSICKSYTDCPDGKGGYIFESQESCKARWNKISNDLKNATSDYSQAMQEQYRLQNELNNQNSNIPIPDYSSNLPTGNYNGNLDFKLPPPQTPTPCPQTRTGEVIPCY